MPKQQVEISREFFEQVASDYYHDWQISLSYCTVDGRVVLGDVLGCEDCDLLRRLVIEESARWGEPTVQLGAKGYLMWAVPVMHNAQVLGGLVAAISEQRIFPTGGGRPAINIPLACTKLRELAEQANVTNAAFLTSQRYFHEQERKKAEAIHVFKLQTHYNLRTLYMVDEPALIAAMNRGDRAQACQILDRLLVGVIHYAGDRFDLVQSFFMELVVTLCRTAVEAGGEATELLGSNYASISELSQIHNDVELAPWLRKMLDRILNAIAKHREHTAPIVASAAVRFINEHCQENLSRDSVAEAMAISPSHFSRMLRREIGLSFTALLSRARIDRASDLLAHTEMSMGQISEDCGFSDQSYFTKVFRQQMMMSPKAYRKYLMQG